MKSKGFNIRSVRNIVTRKKPFMLQLDGFPTWKKVDEITYEHSVVGFRKPLLPLAPPVKSTKPKPTAFDVFSKVISECTM